MNSQRLPISWCELQNHSDDRGGLRVVNFIELPFSPKRFFSVSVSKSMQERGGHSHKECWQMLYAIQGNIQVQIAIDNSISSFSLTEDGPGLIVPPGYWAKQIFLTSFSILGVMASHPFNPDDYVHEIPPVFN